MTDLNASILNIEGELVALGPLRREHIPLYLSWINDFGTTRTLGIPPRPMTLEQETAWYEQTAADDGDMRLARGTHFRRRRLGKQSMDSHVHSPMAGPAGKV